VIRRLPDRELPRVPGRVLGRLGELGLTLWRVDATSGAITPSGSEGGLASPPSGLESACAQWDATNNAEVIEADGRWLLPVPEMHRRKRIAWLVAATDEGTALTPVGAAHMRRMLAWAIEDARNSETQQQELDGLVVGLTNSYDTIQTLYGIGRAMGQVLSPDLFLRGLAEELCHTLPYDWVACVLAPDATRDEALDGRVFRGGTFPGSTPEWDAMLAIAWPAAADHAGQDAALLDEPAGISEVVGAQLVVQPVRCAGRLVALLIAGNRGGDGPHASSYETLMLEAAGGFLGSFLENIALYAEQRATFLGTVKAITAAIDAKDRYTRGHSERVAMLSRRLAEAAGMPEQEAQEIYISGLVHDVGKIGVPEAVLCKPGRLTSHEFEIIKRHPQIGKTILEGIPSLKGVLPGVLHHHERYDGRGYPHGLAGEDIPLMARIMGIADTFDAMSSTRSYRPAMPRERVLAEIERCAGSQFDPDLARVFVTLSLGEYDRMVAEHRASEPVFTPIARDAA